MNYAAIAGKEVQNIDFKGKALLVKRYDMRKVKLNGNEITSYDCNY